MLGIVAVLAIVFAVNWPFTRRGIIRRLERASSLQVEIRSFRSTYFPPGCVAGDVVFRKPGDRDPKPLMVVHQLRIQSSYPGLFSHPKRIQKIEVANVEIHLPPGGAPLKFQAEPDSKSSHSDGDSLVIEEFRAENTLLELARKNRNSNPLAFVIHDSVFRNVATGRTIPFTFSLHLPLPPGELKGSGWLGPWRDDHGSVRSTPISGSCVLKNGDLGVFKSLAGEISAAVNFTGNLQKLELSGNTNSPNFEVKESAHRFPLTTEFRGGVDLLNGDVSLPALSARVGETNLIANARIAGYPKTVELNVTEGKGRIQDLILLFSDAPRSPMTGPIHFHTSIVLPPERRPFKQRVQLAGAFDVDAAQFSSTETQAHVDQLSQRARGEKDKDAAAAQEVLSKLSARIMLANGTANFQQLSFAVPGALANMHGTYNLEDKRVNLRGTMRMKATVSQATKGVKSFFLKILDPFYKKKGVGADVPISLTGRYGHTHFSAGLKK